MSVIRIILLTVGILFMSLQMSLRAEETPINLAKGIVVNTQLEPHETETFRNYARNPTKEQSGEILELILSKVSDLNLGLDLDYVKSADVIAFISIDGVNQVVHIREELGWFGIKFPGFKGIEPDEIIVSGRDLIAIWIVDNIDYYATSVNVEIAKLTPSIRLSSFESPILPRENNMPDVNKIAEIGMKHFDISMRASNLEITFIRRDIDTYEQRTWSRSYRSLSPSFIGIGLDLGVFLPISSTKVSRYSVSSNQITKTYLEKKAFLTLSIYPTQRIMAGGIMRYITPDLVIGVGFPVDLHKNAKNTYMLGLSWKFSGELIKLSAGIMADDKLKNDYQVGDIVPPDAKIVSNAGKIKVVLGITTSLSVISNFIDAF